jgi:hypothetical protein
MRTFLKQVVDSATAGNMIKRGRTGELVDPEMKDIHVDELAEFRGNRPCQRK